MTQISMEMEMEEPAMAPITLDDLRNAFYAGRKAGVFAVTKVAQSIESESESDVYFRQKFEEWHSRQHNSALDNLLRKVNKVTAYHRHGLYPPISAIDELSNAQIEYEEATSTEIEKEPALG